MVDLDRCQTIDCNALPVGKFKPDGRLLCAEHGSRYSRNWAEDHHNVTGLLGIIVRDKP